MSVWSHPTRHNRCVSRAMGGPEIAIGPATGLRARSWIGGLAATLVAVVGVSWGAGSSAAVATCTYTATTQTVAVTLTAGAPGALVRAGDAIDLDGSPCQTATVLNTEQITVLGSEFTDSATIDLSGGLFSNPNLPGDIPIRVDLGASTRDELAI